MTTRHHALFSAFLAGTALGASPAWADNTPSRPVFEVTVSKPDASAPVAASKAGAPESSPEANSERDPLATGAIAPVPVEARYGVAAEAPVDLRAPFDGLEAKPVLNVDTDRDAATAPRDEPLG